VYACSRTSTAVIFDSQSLRAADTVVLVTAASVQDRDAGIPLLTQPLTGDATPTWRDPTP
jgi:hypothetical protein